MWLIIGIALLIWAIADLFYGKVWLHREFNRRYEPIKYWVTWSAWFIIAMVVTLGSI